MAVATTAATMTILLWLPEVGLLMTLCAHVCSAKAEPGCDIAAVPTTREWYDI